MALENGIRKRKRSSHDSLSEQAPCNGVNIVKWSASDVFKYLQKKHIVGEDLEKVFREKGITGEEIPHLTDKILEEMGINGVTKRKEILDDFDELVKKRGKMELDEEEEIEERKVFNDPIHGHIELHPLCIRIIDTVQFQRLRNIKQLGACYMVFPGAAHNRFEHSLGVCHLAGMMTRALRSRQPKLDITEGDILCVEIAGLCHDLGHGPFSHLFDGKFIPAVRADAKWKHEDGSARMFDHLVESNNLVPEFAKFGLSQRDLVFIKELIQGPSEESDDSEEWTYRGRDRNKSFLYEVVSNKKNGNDVDKWDYFARDCHQLGISYKFDHARFIKFARVLQVDGKLEICCRDKEVGNLYDMFHTRHVLHRRAYQHKTNSIIEIMITEALVKAHEHLLFQGKEGKMYNLAECIDDMQAYEQLTDHIFYQILYSEDTYLREAKEILQKVQRRQLYKCVGQSRPLNGVIVNNDKLPDMKRELVTILSTEELGREQLREEDLILDLIYLDYGMKEKNPIENSRFYMKSNPTTPIRIRRDQVSEMLPQMFAEQHLRVYTRTVDQSSMDVATACFHKWCEKNNFAQPKGADVLTMTLTPLKVTPVKTTSTQPSHCCTRLSL